MPDLTVDLLPRLQAHRLPGLDLGEGRLYPYYEGYSLLNLPASICRLLGAPGLGAPPLAKDILAQCGGDYHRVILLVLDGLGFDLLGRFWQVGLGKVWQDHLPDAVFAPLTSVCPSTTATALTTLWTGSSPAEHAVVGYELWLREYAVVANMILHAPMLFNNDIGGLKRAGFQPEEFLTVPVLAPHLQRYDIDTYAFMHQSIAHSGLSTMHMRQANVESFRSNVDLWVSARQFVERRSSQKQYIYIYWGDIDELSHRYGPDDERVAGEFDAFSQVFERSFLSRLSREEGKDTLLIVTADHGLVRTPRYQNYELRYHPRLTQALHMQPTGENRLAYFYLKPGQEDEVRAYLETTWPGQFDILTTGQALQAGLLGPGTADARLSDRVGDLWVIARKDAYLWWAEQKENHLLGRHGGLSQTEMLVPFLAIRL